MSALNLKPQIKTVDMSEEMSEFAIETATFALGEYNIESHVANHIKREFDKKYRCAWAGSSDRRQYPLASTLEPADALGRSLTVPGLHLGEQGESTVGRNCRGGGRVGGGAEQRVTGHSMWRRAGAC